MRLHLWNSGVIHTSSLLPSQLYLDHSHCLVLAPATLAALPSTRAIPDRDVFYVTHPIRSIPIESRMTSRKSCPVRAQNARCSNVTCVVMDPATFFY